MAGPDLKVEYDILEQTEKTLNSLRSEFDNCEAQERVYDPEWGSGDVKDAMHSFTDNWKKNREHLQKSIESVGKLVSESIEAFKKADAKLASEFDKKS
jgi:uncharacterized protein YukE